MLLNPENLLTYKRWDILVKYVYAKYLKIYLELNPKLKSRMKQNLNVNIIKDQKNFEWFYNLYCDHIKVFNGGSVIGTKVGVLNETSIKDLVTELING